MFAILLENILNSFESILANKMRSALSMLGIIIGVSSVIILTAIGNGSSQTIVSKVEEMGTNILTLSAGGGFGSTREKSTSGKILNDALISGIQENVSGLSSVVPIISTNGQIVYGSSDMSATVYGINPDFFTAKNVEIVAGTSITQDALSKLDKVAVIGQDVVSELFFGENPIGKEFTMGNNVFQVVGVIEENSTLGSYVFIPITTAGIRITGQKYYSQILIEVEDADQVDTIETNLDTFLQKYLNVSDTDSLPYSIRNQSEMLENLSSITETLTMLLSGIAAISLLVGGIGVMNIMLVSVTERTKEIGIRKAIGAVKSDILLQFLTEALSLSVLGGIIGIFLSYAVVFGLNTFNIAAIISSDSLFLSFLFSLGIGIIFGILPAYKAAKLRPIDALRYE